MIYNSPENNRNQPEIIEKYSTYIENLRKFVALKFIKKKLIRNFISHMWSYCRSPIIFTNMNMRMCVFPTESKDWRSKKRLVFFFTAVIYNR